MIKHLKNFEQFINENIERTSYKNYKVGDIISGTLLDKLSGDLVGNDIYNDYILVQKLLSDFTYTRLRQFYIKFFV